MAKWMGLFLVCFAFACGDKKTSLSGDAPVEKNEFIAAFAEIKLPTTVYDSSLERIGDTTTISKKVFTQFIPDSSFKAVFGDDKKAIIRPVGKIKKDEELYLLAKVAQGKHYKLGVFVFDNDQNFKDGMELLNNKQNDGYSHYVGINREPTFTIGRDKMTPDNKQFYTRTGYAFTKDVGFMIIVNDSNEDTKKNEEIINPVDTFARANKFSGDYVKDKKNFISLRDGKNTSTYLFFIHFEKNDGKCTGELKGELVMKDEKKGQYTANGDPCVINFILSNSDIRVKEEGSCGNHRDIKCFFDDTYNRKREPKQKQKGK